MKDCVVGCVVAMVLAFSIMLTFTGCWNPLLYNSGAMNEEADEWSQDLNNKKQEDQNQKAQMMIDQIQGYVDDLDYPAAIERADQYIQENPQDQILKTKKEDVLLAYQEHVSKELQKNTDEGLYPKAIKQLNGFIEDDPERKFLNEMKDNLIRDYKDYAYSTSLSLAHNEKYTEALALAKEGLEYFESKKIEDLIPILESYMPVAIGDMEIFSNDTHDGSYFDNTWSFVRSEYLVDNYGTEYENSVSADAGSVYYLVNYEYQKLFGNVAYPKNAKKKGPSSASAQIIIWGYKEDGTSDKLYTSSLFQEHTKPEQFDIDISNYERIEIYWNCEGEIAFTGWGYYATIFDGYFMPMPLELPE